MAKKKKKSIPLREDVKELKERQLLTKDEKRQKAVEKRHASQKRTARENIADLCDPGSFEEIGSLIVAGQKGRTPIDELRKKPLPMA